MRQFDRDISLAGAETNPVAPHYHGTADIVRRLEKRLEAVEASLDESKNVIEKQADFIGTVCIELARMRRVVDRNREVLNKRPSRASLVHTNVQILQMLRVRGELGPRALAGAAYRVLRGKETTIEKRPRVPRVCFVGDGFAGSWRMRALQIARMRPGWKAKATKRLRSSDLKRYDVFVFVKRFDTKWAERIRDRQKLVIYDIVDPWKQPEDGLAHQTLPEVHKFFEKMLGNLPVDGVIFPNRAMYEDLRHLTPNPIIIHHHFRPDLVPAPVRPAARRIGYEGREEYLGEWHAVIERICQRNGLEFVVNPENFNSIDIGFIARGGEHGSLMAKRYKSNVKLANMLGAGIPTVVQHGEESYSETGGDLIRYFSTPEQLEAAIKELLPYRTRAELHRQMLPHSLQFSIEHLTDQYEAYFKTLLQQRGIFTPNRPPSKWRSRMKYLRGFTQRRIKQCVGLGRRVLKIGSSKMCRSLRAAFSQLTPSTAVAARLDEQR